ncbi:ABC transporter substrate-binding protein [Metallumcola ferriviriculae]|uniref:ABC transporter substrate-binding protein n=1 Tax=Metallumcola ferriviriculae TaxID=3039180 RepID=A0AAU0UR04_9FIRM|nr:ABC transporter substrate-binding protein [Desulfitibacteraceae bacterium MK1]
MNKRVKLILCVLVISLISVGLLTACSAGNQESDAKDDKGKAKVEVQAEPTFLDELKETGVIRVGSTPTGPPFTFLNPKSNEIEGLMVDIASLVGDELGLKVEINAIQFSSLIPSVQSEKIDLVSAGMAITEDRAKVIDFSIPVYSYGGGLVVAKDNNEIKQFEDFSGKKIGVQEGTVYANYMKDYPEIETQTYKSIADMVKELKFGRLDALIGDYPIVARMLAENPDFKKDVKLVREYKPKEVVKIGMGFPKGTDEFQDTVNAIIQKLQENGELDKLLEKWGLK